MQTLDLTQIGLREVNKTLHEQAATTNQTAWTIENARGSHAIACGLDAPIEVTVKGSTGYYCGGMNKQATINIHGSAGPGTGENIMSGKIVIEGDASQYLGATGHGGLIVVKGNASSRCGI
ncbi:MAG: protein GlxC, partial [Alphaproteobacteria bacterium]